MEKAQTAYESAKAIQSVVDIAKADAEKCVADVEAVRDSLAKMITYQGSVDNYSDLPTSPQVGYSYNIKNADKEHGVSAGDNVVWNGEDWDNFGGAIDMSLFAELGKDARFNTVTATLNGNAATASKLATPRTISLTGNASGSATFDGSGNISISTTVNDSKHAAAADSATAATKIVNNGNRNDIANGAKAPSGLSVYQCYVNTGYPQQYGNVVSIGGTGDNELFLGWMDDSRLLYRAKRDNESNWKSWRAIAFTDEINNYAPTKTGGGASGTWGININGNAASATNADKVDGIHAASMFYHKGIWDANNWATIGTYQVNNNPPISGAYGWGQVISSSTTDGRFQLYASDNYGGNGRLHYRTGWDGRKNSWNTILDSENYNSFAPTKTGSGASGTWGININGTATTALNIPTSDVGGNIWIS